MSTRSAKPAAPVRAPSPRRKAEPELGHEPVGKRVSRVRMAEGSHGRLRIVLQRVAGGLYVEREDVPKHGMRTCVSLEFGSCTDFLRWYDEDASRFEHPLLHQRVRRDADELWQLGA
jgi:hypothetical protein